jgi:hypothetical protein
MNAIQETVQLAEKRKSKGILKKIGKFLLRGVLVLAAAAAVAQLAYTFSGSGKWEYAGKKDGVAIYTMKVPGSNLKQFTAIFHLKASMSRIVMFMQDNDSDLDVDFYAAKELSRESSQVFVTTWRSGFPAPFQDRDFVVRHVFSQDPKTKEVSYVLRALPNLIPKDKCCVRVPLMDNTWRLIPMKDGEVEIQWVIDMAIGGFMPYFVINQANPEIMTDFATKLQGYVDRPKYANAKFDWLQEPQL